MRWQRRRLLLAAPAVPLALAGCGSASVQTLPTVAVALQAIEGLATGWRSTGAWSLAQVLNHAAQSIEYSMNGFPESKSALFRATLGSAAFAVFDARGAMSHSLAEPIPGAPALAAADALPAAIGRASTALRAFEAHAGSLAPHFAYGTLDKAQYTRAHLMHLANHWSEFARA
jgi:hypothetical protein